MIEMADSSSSLIIFIIFVLIALFSAARAVANKERRKKIKRRPQRFRPYQPPTVQQIRYPPSTAVQSPAPRRATVSPTPTETQYQSRMAYATAEEYFRAGLYDQAKEEYLKTGRIFGAAKAVAAKGHDYIKEAIGIIQRYAPEREEEMVRNLSRYFFDSGDVETAAIILHEYGLSDEAEAVCADVHCRNVGVPVRSRAWLPAGRRSRQDHQIRAGPDRLLQA